MTGEPTPPDTGREALMVWLKLVLLLVGIFAFGLLIFELRRQLH